MIVPSERLEKSKTENVIPAGKKRWIHRDVNCKNVQLIPIKATSVICEKCNATVEIPPAPLKTGQYTLDMNHSRLEAKNKTHFHEYNGNAKNTW